MKTYSYIRVSSADQCEHRQVLAMQELNIPPENIFTDKQRVRKTRHVRGFKITINISLPLISSHNLTVPIFL